jgi:hypothetical protein
MILQAVAPHHSRTAKASADAKETADEAEAALLGEDLDVGLYKLNPVNPLLERVGFQPLKP